MLEAVPSPLMASKLKGAFTGAIKNDIVNINYVQVNIEQKWKNVSFTFNAPLDAELKKFTKHIF